jgi:hypothetical protein
VSGEQAVAEIEVFTNDEGRVRISVDILLVDIAGLDQVFDDATEECDIGAGTDRCVKVRQCRRTGESRVDDDPMMSTRLVFLISTQWLVIAPRPNVGARLATVGPCHTRA